jgi:hypothetical protein
MDTWLPRVALCFVFATVALLAAIIIWLVVAPEQLPRWLWVLLLGIGFAGAVLCHIYNAAHDSLPPD